ncbi:MAG: exosortase/archaeosortase family protein [Kordiimonadaceae bacterium]|nr:exosortase/archaeosortase family protein [Kordiimonadaceae bacterium]
MIGKAVSPKVSGSLLVAALALLTLAWWDTVQHLANLIVNVDTFSHGQIIPFISLWLIWDRRSLLKAEDTFICWLGLPLLLLACLLWYAGVLLEMRVVEHLAYVSAIQSLLLIFIGPLNYQRLLFPCLFLYLMVPFGYALIPFMQQLTADMVVWLLGMLGVAHEADGLYITLQSGVYEVAQACAGVRFLFTSLVTGVLLAHLTCSRWQSRLRLLVVAAAIPIVANVIRVLGILLISEATDQSFAKDVDHIIYGWVFLSAILLLLISTAYKFADDAAPYNGEVIVYSAKSMGNTGAAFTVLLALLLPLSMKQVIPATFLATVEISPLQPPVCQECGIRLLRNAPTKNTVLEVGATKAYDVTYRVQTDQITVAAALYCPLLPGSNLMRPARALLKNGWSLDRGFAAQKKEFAGWHFKVQRYKRGAHSKMVWTSVYMAGEGMAEFVDIKLMTAIQRATFGASAAAVLSASVIVYDPQDTPTAVFEKLFSTFSPDSFLWAEIKPSMKGRRVCVE